MVKIKSTSKGILFSPLMVNGYSEKIHLIQTHSFWSVECTHQLTHVDGIIGCCFFLILVRILRAYAFLEHWQQVFWASKIVAYIPKCSPPMGFVSSLSYVRTYIHQKAYVAQAEPEAEYRNISSFFVFVFLNILEQKEQKSFFYCTSYTNQYAVWAFILLVTTFLA